VTHVVHHVFGLARLGPSEVPVERVLRRCRRAVRAWVRLSASWTRSAIVWWAISRAAAGLLVSVFIVCSWLLEAALMTLTLVLRTPDRIGQLT
jgi:hypothetical protein